MKQILIFLSLFLVGCSARAPQPSLPPEAIFSQSKQSLEGIDRFSVKGRVGILNGNEGGSAGFVWQQSQQSYQIELIAPLGIATSHIRGNEAEVILLSPAGGQEVTANPSALIERYVGFSVPLPPFLYWVKGLPYPDSPKRFLLDRHGRLQSLYQAGWDIQYRQYQRVGELYLPRKITLSKAQVQVRLILKDWVI